MSQAADREPVSGGRSTGELAASTQGGETTRIGTVLVAVGVACPVVLFALGLLFDLQWFLLAVGILLGGAMIAIGVGKSRRKSRKSEHAAAPLGFTPEGQAIYPVVGYTTDGQPVTADRVAGPLVGGYSSRTNSMAIAALVLGVVAGPLAIPFGHIARSQIARTGEQGGGMALAGLILGYIGLVSLIGFVILFAVAANSGAIN